MEQLLQFTGKVTLPSNPISSELDISRCSSEEGSGSTNENLDHAIVFQIPGAASLYSDSQETVHLTSLIDYWEYRESLSPRHIHADF